ncbi:MAG: cysteine--tRNA ligase [DPANN group archaeon]|nr:cysteine--tRNA ligase [DPANN group archaeon]
MIKLYNTLTRQKEEFKTINDKEVTFYSCGPTVYWYAHIGNLRAYVFADLLKKTLEYNGYKVRHAMNITDVGHLTSDSDTGEDKMEKAKKREGKNAWEIAKFYEAAFFMDTDRLNIARPTITCRATDHIKEQISLVTALEEKGYTYRIEDGIYFDTSKLSDYGKLARLDIEGLKAGARIELVPGKKNPTDFALWKFSPKDAQRDMEWDSPWGIGFPGWHIECSAMSMHHLGNHFDIHTGGVDHIPVHHTNEIAQSESATGEQFVNYWLHNEFVNFKDVKMSKSSGDILTLDVLINSGYSPMDYRYLLLMSHYRSQVTFSLEAMDNVKNTLERLKRHVVELRKSGTGKINEAYVTKFVEKMNDDLSTPEALSVMWEMVRDDSISSSDKYATLLDFDKILSLGIAEMQEEKVELTPDEQALVEKRDKARAEKDWKTSDEIRDELKKRGLQLLDTPEGTKVEQA